MGLATVVLLAVGVQETEQDSFRRGRALLESGNPEAALVLWLRSRDSLSLLGQEDPRIATAFVHTVVAEDLERYEDVAADVFYWGFSTDGRSSEARREILSEGERTLALLDSTEADRWIVDGRHDPSTLARRIKQFWIESDPSPTTVANERLIEHWNRIVHAQRSFVYNRTSPYDTDDRGVIYVRYGEPDRILKGHLGVNGSDRRLLDLPYQYIMLYDRQPQYEVWRYATLRQSEFTYFMFGNTEGTGPFRVVTGLHELIPRNARSPSARHRGVRAQHYLELFYYGDLARMGGPYGRRFTRLSNLWTQSRFPNDGTLEAVSQRNIADDIGEAARPRPLSWSEIDDTPRSALSAQVARTLEEDRPRLLVLAVSSPRWTPTHDSVFETDSLTLDAYVARHTTIVRDKELREIVRVGLLPTGGQEDMTSAVLHHSAEIAHVTVAANHEIDYESGGGHASAYPGQAHFQIDSPLVRRENGIDVSDLVVGLVPRPEYGLPSGPVPLLPATRFWKEDVLRAYFEVYRASSTPLDDVATFDVQLRLDRVRQEERSGDQATIRVRLDSQGPTGRHFFDLDLRNENPGEIRLVLEITDTATGATLARVTPVQVLDR